MFTNPVSVIGVHGFGEFSKKKEKCPELKCALTLITIMLS